MGRMKELAIKQAEENLEYLYEKYYIEAALIQAEAREEYEQHILNEQINQDKDANRREEKGKQGN